MAFCTKCGAQLSDHATVCPACGQARRPASKPVLATPAMGTGFVASLFDFSFTSFVTTKLVKLLYGIGVVFAAMAALAFAGAGFTHSLFFGFLTLLIAPLMFFAAVIYWRVLMELIIVLFRAAEHLTEISRRSNIDAA
jgi:uncharacterized membrane protein